MKVKINLKKKEVVKRLKKFGNFSFFKKEEENKYAVNVKSLKKKYGIKNKDRKLEHIGAEDTSENLSFRGSLPKEIRASAMSGRKRIVSRNFAEDFANALRFNRRHNANSVVLADSITDVDPSDLTSGSETSTSFDVTDEDSKLGSKSFSSPYTTDCGKKKIKGSVIKAMNSLKRMLGMKLPRRKIKSKRVGLFDLEGNPISDDESLSSPLMIFRDERGFDRYSSIFQTPIKDKHKDMNTLPNPLHRLPRTCYLPEAARSITVKTPKTPNSSIFGSVLLESKRLSRSMKKSLDEAVETLPNPLHRNPRCLVKNQEISLQTPQKLLRNSASALLSFEMSPLQTQLSSDDEEFELPKSLDFPRNETFSDSISDDSSITCSPNGMCF